MKLTKAAVAGLTLPAGCDDKTYWDDDIPMFGVRLRKGGSKGWVFWYRLGGRASPLRKIGLGATSAMSAAEARAEAAKLHAKVQLGQDPGGREGRKRRAGGRDGRDHVLQTFLARQAERLKPRSYVGVEYHLLESKSKPFHRLPARCGSIDALSRSCWRRSASPAGPFAANRLRAEPDDLFHMVRCARG